MEAFLPVAQICLHFRPYTNALAREERVSVECPVGPFSEDLLQPEAKRPELELLPAVTSVICASCSQRFPCFLVQPLVGN